MKFKHYALGMNLWIKVIVVGWLAFLGPQILVSQAQLQFTQLTQSFTNCILKDDDGFIWVGTQDGLLRYGNFEFDVFRYQSDQKYSLPNNYIRDIIEDQNNNLWIGTFGGGLVKWDRELERFYSFSMNTANESIHTLELLSDSILLVGSEDGLLNFNINTGEVNQLLEEENENAKFINDIFISDIDGQIFLGTNNGLYLYKYGTEAYDQFLETKDLIVYCIEGLNHRIYIGTNKGLFIYNKRKQTFEKSIQDKSISTILIINNDEWYVGTNSGIGIYKEGEGYHWSDTSLGSQYDLKSDLIHTLYNIDDEYIWAGTRKGVHQFSMKRPNFKSLDNLYSNFSCSSTTLGMAEDKNTDIWICSRDGLMKLKLAPNTNEWEAYCHTKQNTPGMMDNYTINITADKYDNLWLAYRNNGFSKLVDENGNWVWQNFPLANKQLGGDGINQVFQDWNGDYWLASRGKGLIFFDQFDESLTFYDENEGLTHPYIFRIFQNEEDVLWLSTANGGLCKFDLLTKTFECNELNHKDPASISSNMVLATNNLSSDKLLVCTVEGLNILNQDGTYDKITTFDGLPNNVVYAALEDDNGKIWVSTNEGISMLDLTQEVPGVTNYNKSHGLSSFEYNQHSYLEHSSGLFLFGGVEGVTVFDPIDVVSHKVVPNIALTDFQLFNNSVPIRDENAGFSLDKAINVVDEIQLDYDQNSIAFEFAALGITNSENLLYQYRLEGLESDWINASGRNYAAYPKVASGKYTFKVRLTDFNKNPITDEKSVNLLISRPPWHTWWAYLIYLLLFALALYLILHLQKERTLAIARARENERDVFRKKLARDFHDEAGNKITRISLITDTLTRKSRNTDLVNTLTKLQDNIQDLRSGMTDFIWVLDPGKDSLGETLRRFMDFANDVFEDSDIDFIMDPIDPAMNTVVMPSNARRHFLLIMKEAITNILKHANPKLVRFTYSNVGEKWIFNLIDDGKGFEMDELKRINGMRNMKTRAEKINGFLEIKSKKGSGSNISLAVKL